MGTVRLEMIEYVIGIPSDRAATSAARDHAIYRCLRFRLADEVHGGFHAVQRIAVGSFSAGVEDCPFPIRRLFDGVKHRGSPCYCINRVYD